MVKRLAVLVVCGLMSVSAFGQELQVDQKEGAKFLSKGDLYVSGKLAVGAVYGASSGFVASGEYGLQEGFLNLGDFPASLGVGGSIGYSSYTTYYWNYTNIIVLGSAYYHADVLDAEQIDTYIVLHLGINVGTVKWDGPFSTNETRSSGGLVTGSGIGARYFLTDNLAVSAEVGYGMGLLRLGVDLGI